MLDRETWEFINSFADWFSALGTIAAVVVSLYLALRETGARLRVTAGVYHLITPGEVPAESDEYFQIQVTNIGFRDVIIRGIIWRAGFFRKKHFIQMPPSNLLSDQLPKKLAHGEEARLLFELARFKRGTARIQQALTGSRFPGLAAHSLKVGVHISTGEEFVVPAGKGVRDLLLAPPDPAA